MSSLDLFALICDTGLFVLIWLVQLVIYPSFREIDESRFCDWHATYSSRVSFVVVPLMLGQLVASLANLIQFVSIFEAAHLAGVALSWHITLNLAVPFHRRLGGDGKEMDVIDRLIRINWLRTASWTGVWGISLWRNLIAVFS